MRNRTRLIGFSVAVAVVAIGSTAWWHHRSVERAYADAILLSALGEISLAENSLRLIDEGRIDAAREILREHSDSALRSAEEARTYGAGLDGAWPNLRASLGRASRRARAEGRASVAERIDSLVAVLESGSRPGRS